MNQNIKRAETDQEIAERNGFTLKPTIYPFGTPVNTWGVNNYSASRKEYEMLPLVDDMVAELDSVIKAEDRWDDTLPLQELWMMPDRAIISEAIDGVRYLPSEWAHKQLIERTRPYDENNDAVVKAASYASDLGSPNRFSKDITNYYLKTSADKKGRSIVSNFRTRKIDTELEESYGGYRELFAVVTGKYNTDCDANQLAEMVRRKVEDSKIPAKADGLYDKKRFKMSVLYHSDLEVTETPVAGELFKAGFTIESSDDGSRGISITPMVMRNLCLNFIILDKATQRVNLTHLRSELYESVSDSIDIAMKKVSEFGERWGAASKEKIVSKVYSDIDPEKIFTQLVKQGHVKLHGFSKDEMISRLISSWEHEPGYMKTDILNAITRAAHRFNWNSPWTSTDLEEAAGKLLYSKLALDY